jgi:hypothetical protein
VAFIRCLKLNCDINGPDASGQDGDVCHRFFGVKMHEKPIIIALRMRWDQ